MVNNTLVATDSILKSWASWIGVTRDRCHLNFELAGGTVASHISICYAGALKTAQRVRQDIGDDAPIKKILEVGSSVGFNCLALSQIFPSAEVFGVEPDSEAVAVGTAMANENSITNIHLYCGVGETLSFDSNYFDLIVCHTVIEHVGDVEKVIAEMARTLAPGGQVHIEAPNYIWPFEPHLGILCVPLLGKRFVRLCAILQGKSSQIGYLGHLKFVYPAWLEREFRANKLEWENRTEKKIAAAMSGENGAVRQYRRLAYILRIISQLGLGKWVTKILVKSQFYPSVLYTLHKNRAA